MIVYTATDINASACPIFCDLIQQKRLAFIAAEFEGKYMIFIYFLAQNFPVQVLVHKLCK
jgi:hypothetical protein